MRMKGSEMILQNFTPMENQHGLIKPPAEKWDGTPIKAQEEWTIMKIGMLTPLNKERNIETFN